MSNYVLVRSIVPILLLIGAGILSRRMNLLRTGDERVLSAYVYYFALPALLFINMTETRFTVDTLVLMFVNMIPIFIVLSIYVFLYLICRFSKTTLFLLIVSTVFGSLAFFGIPFISFTFPGELFPEREHLVTLAIASISPISVSISMVILELSKIKDMTIRTGLHQVFKRLAKNPLLLSIILGILFSIFRLEIPSPISDFLHMLGRTTSTIAIFMLGVFFYGRKYSNIVEAVKIGLLRIVFLPIIALLIAHVFQLTDLERAILVLMHSMPTAISMMILSERYNFYEETIASLILISSLGAGIYLNVWLLLLGYP
jgi:predicted permease